MSADFTPTPRPYKKLGPFRYWIQKVLPVVFDDSLSYQELLGKVIDYLNTMSENVSNQQENVELLTQAFIDLQDYVNTQTASVEADFTELQGSFDTLQGNFNTLQTYVNDYFDNLDVQDEINVKLDDMAEAGTLEEIMQPFFQSLYDEYSSDVTTLQNQMSQLVAETTTNLSGETITTLSSGSIQVTGGVAHYQFSNLPAGYKIIEVSRTDTSGFYITDGIMVEESTDVVAVHAPVADSNATTIKLVYSVLENVQIPELTDIRVGADGITYPTAGDAVRGQVNMLINSLNLTERISLNRCFFIYQATLAYSNNAPTTQDNEKRSRSTMPFTLNAPVIIGSSDPNINICLGNATGWITEPSWFQSYYFDKMTDFYLVIKRVDDTNVVATDIDSLYIMTTKAGLEEFNQKYRKTITGSCRFETFNDTEGNIYRYKLGTETENLGMCIRRNASSRVSSKPYICEDELDIWIGNFESGTMVGTVFINNAVVATLDCGSHYTVPANTPFTISFSSNSANSSNVGQTYSLMITKNLAPYELGTGQYMTSSTITRADSSFIVGNKVFMISSTGLYSVKQGMTYLVSDAALDVSAGHANSCNYLNGKVYVSDWYEPIIHVYDVDLENNTLTWNKNIPISLPEGQGNTEFYVFDDEKQIFFLGWENENSAADPNSLVYGLYILTTQGYKLSWIKYAVRNTILQGFTKQDKYLYYIDNTTNYKTINVNRINMETGETQYNTELAGTILNNETEAITPVGNQVFLLVDVRGRTFLVIFNK